MRQKRYFAGGSAHGSETSHGFSNDWFVYAFATKTERDRFVEKEPNLSIRAIPANKVTHYARNLNLSSNEYYEPTPFTGEYWGIVKPEQFETKKPCTYLGRIKRDYPDFIGEVSVCKPYDSHEPLYR